MLAVGLGLVAMTRAEEHGITARAIPAYEEFDLVSDVTNAADHLDVRLVNPWGSVVQRNAVWVAANGTGLLLAFNAAGAPVGTAIHVPGAGGAGSVGAPTGLVLNRSQKFVVSSGGRSAPATFLVATEDGTIAAWSEALAGENAVTVADNSAAGAVYKGLAVAETRAGEPQVYAADFHGGKIDVFGADFKPGASFTDKTVPAGYGPFNIQLIRGRLFVTFAKQAAPDLKDDEPGLGNGYVDIFDRDGTLVRRLISGGELDSPWGLALEAGGPGARPPALLVGNFGDGKINAFDLTSGAFLGQLKRPNGDDLIIDRLWGLVVARGEAGGEEADEGAGVAAPDHDPGDRDAARLFFAAGIHDEAHGLFGFVRPIATLHPKAGDH